VIRITKLTDYGVVIMAFMAGEPSRLFQARELAAETAVSRPTVSKLLKKLTKNKLLTSQRGTNGGYLLALAPEKISVAELVNVLEGPIAITECNLGNNHCPTASQCSLKAPWQRINNAITQALSSVKLSDLVNPMQNIGSEEHHGKH